MRVAEFVGFSAYSAEGVAPADGERLPFESVVTNAGGGYDNNTSVFTCPANAYYYFYFSLYLRMNQNFSDCHVDITLDGVLIVEVTQKLKRLHAICLKQASI